VSARLVVSWQVGRFGLFLWCRLLRPPFAEVAEIVGRTPTACRQLVSAARRRIRPAQAPATPAAHQAGIVRAFKQAWEATDIDALIAPPYQADAKPAPTRQQVE